MNKIFSNWHQFVTEETSPKNTIDHQKVLKPTGLEKDIYDVLTGYDYEDLPVGRLARLGIGKVDKSFMDEFLGVFDLPEIPDFDDIEKKYEELKGKVSEHIWPVVQELLFEILISKLLLKGMKLPKGKKLGDLLKDPDAARELLKKFTIRANDLKIAGAVSKVKFEEFKKLYEKIYLSKPGGMDFEDFRLQSIWDILTDEEKETVKKSIKSHLEKFPKIKLNNTKLQDFVDNYILSPKEK
tara:strand:- start:2045 stop:2764 length:720 start_codon:yes stop_codon:yes gene_type:complete